jgi:DNA modification methylase
MPESVRDRPMRAHEYLFLLSKSEHYWYDREAIREPQSGTARASGHGVTPKSAPTGDGRIRANENFRAATARFTIVPGGRNRRTVWTLSTAPYREAHFATFPPDLVKPCILAGCPEGGTVIDPFAGSCTTALVAKQHGRRSIMVEPNAVYLDMGIRRL